MAHVVYGTNATSDTRAAPAEGHGRQALLGGAQLGGLENSVRTEAGGLIRQVSTLTQKVDGLQDKVDRTTARAEESRKALATLYDRDKETRGAVDFVYGQIQGMKRVIEEVSTAGSELYGSFSPHTTHYTIQACSTQSNPDEPRKQPVFISHTNRFIHIIFLFMIL